MKQSFRMLALVAALALSSAAFAWGDWSITIGGFLGDVVSDVLPVEEVGSTLYGAQEGVHQTLRESTGISVDYFYIWVCTGDECIPVDPIRFGN